MTKLPQFNLPQQTTITNEKLDQAGNMNFIDEAGRYDLRIVEAQFQVEEDGSFKTYKNDPTWLRLQVKMATAEGKETRTLVPFPTVKFTYGEKDSLIMLKQIRSFLSSLGILLDMSDVAKVSEILTSIGNNTNLLIGAPIVAELHYPGYHVKSISADKFVICASSGDIVKDTITKQPLEFGNRDAAKTHIEVKLKSKVSYIEIKEYVIPEKAVISVGTAEVGAATGTDDGLEFE